MTLDDICIKCDTDKASSHKYGAHGYAVHYDAAFASMREQPIKLLEIGVNKGASMAAWLEYFQLGRVFGVDIEQGKNPWNTLHTGIHPRYTFAAGDQRKPEFWEAFLNEHGREWDIVVDDGGHYADMVLTSFTCLWPHVKPGGFYCVEDLGTGYAHYTQGRVQCTEVYFANCIPAGWPNHKDYIKDLVDRINLDNGIESIAFSKELAIIKKAQL